MAWDNINRKEIKMGKVYKISLKSWVKKNKLTPKEMLDKKELIVFKNEKLGQEFAKKNIVPDKISKDKQ